MPVDVNFRFSLKSDPVFDYWSVGLIILEILIGSEFILTAKYHREVIEIFEDF